LEPGNEDETSNRFKQTFPGLAMARLSVPIIEVFTHLSQKERPHWLNRYEA